MLVDIDSGVVSVIINEREEVYSQAAGHRVNLAEVESLYG